MTQSKIPMCSIVDVMLGAVAIATNGMTAMTDAPLLLRYEGDGEFRTISSWWAGRADKAFVVGELYRLVEHHDRSMNSHRHFFASIAEAWKNLPDEMLDEYPTAEHLRKRALIRKGYADERSFVCASKAEAQRMAAFMKPMDDYAVVSVREAVVRVWTAKSQSVKAMGNRDFQQSKSDVLDFVAGLLGVTADELGKAQAA